MVMATAKMGDFDRFWNPFSTKGAENESSTVAGGRMSFGIQMRATGFGRSSTGTRRAGRASPRTRRSRRSFRKPGCARSAKVGGVPPPARRLEEPAWLRRRSRTPGQDRHLVLRLRHALPPLFASSLGRLTDGQDSPLVWRRLLMAPES